MKVVLIDVQAESKEDVLKEIAEVASIETGVSQALLLEGFLMREAQTSTGMVEGVAIPHTMQDIETAMLVVCKSAPISNWQTLDGSSVELEIAIIAPSGGEEHLKVLSQVSRKLINSENIEKLKLASDVATVKEILEI